MTKRIHSNVLLTLLILGSPILNYAVFGPGSAWLYVRLITLSPVAPAAGYQVKVTLSSGQYTHMNATDGRDLRFYDAANNSCNYWIETWNTSGTSTIWVKVVITGTSSLYMYYGNASPIAVSNGSATFDFFDDFPGSSLAGNWSSNASGGSITVTGSRVTLSNTNAGTVSISSQFTPASTLFMFETKHHEGAYNRNRFYLTPFLNGGSPTGFDYGYFTCSPASVFWNSACFTAVTAGTEYMTQWQIRDGSTYIWSLFSFPPGSAIDTRSATVTATIRYISFQVTEVANTSTIIDWVRVRQLPPSASEPAAALGSEIANLSASISAQTNVLCYAQPTGSITVIASGGTAPYTYAWSTIPLQNTQTAVNLPAGIYIVTVIESGMGLQTTATATITQLPVVSASVSNQTNLSCFAGSNGRITITASGGTPNYFFSIDNGTTWFPSSGPGITGPYEYTGLDATTIYRTRVRDSNGCLSPLMP